MVSYSNNSQDQMTEKQSFHPHSIHKSSSSKPWKTKPSFPNATALPPPPSLHPKVYKVHPIHFRELVQRLTGQSQLHHQSPPPPPPVGVQSFGGGSLEMRSMGGAAELCLSSGFEGWLSFLSQGSTQTRGII